MQEEKLKKIPRSKELIAEWIYWIYKIDGRRKREDVFVRKVRSKVGVGG